MKKIITLLFFLSLFSSGICFSQFGWYWSHPSPVGSHLEDVFFVNENTGYAVGWQGTIIKTINGGANWVQLNSGTNIFFYSVYFTSVDTGYVVSGDNDWPVNSVVLKTTNGGLNWFIQNTFNDRSLFSVFFLNSQTGFIVGSYFSLVKGYLYKTTDAGENWNQLLYDDASAFYDVKFLNDTIGYVAAEDKKLFKTTNGGTNWIILSIGNVYSDFQSICFTNMSTGYLVGSGGAIFKTSNGGYNWVQQNSGTTTNLFKVLFKNENTGFAVGGLTLRSGEGKFLRTTNGGLNWDSLYYGISQNLIGLAKLNDSGFISVGYWGMIVKTTNNGNNFLQISNRQNKNDINSVYFLNNNTGITVGDSSSVMKTTNQGSTWQFSKLGNNYELNSIYFISENTGYIAGGSWGSYPFGYNHIKIYKTTDAGSNWSVMYGNNNEVGFGVKVLFLNSITGFVISENRVLKTTNSGINWVQSFQSPTVYFLRDLKFVNNLKGFVCGARGLLAQTTDCGNSWNLINLNRNNWFYGISNNKSDTLYVVGRNIIMKTTNCGSNWIAQPTEIVDSVTFYSVSFINNNVGYAVGSSDGSLMFGSHGGGDIVKTTNGGANWNHVTSRFNMATFPAAGPLNSICIVNDDIYLVGGGGIIIKNETDLNPIAIKNYSNSIPYSPSLSQNYPNPFNPVTKIKYDISPSKGARGMMTKLIIFDILGREIETLVNETQRPGSYEVTWDGSRYASGVYFYRLVTDEYVETKKMVLIK